jgi:hypothetical protein
MGLLGSLLDSVSGTPDFGSLSREELLRRMPDYLNSSQSVSMYLMLEDLKPGVLNMSAGEDQREFIEAFCKKFDYHYREYPGFRDPGVFVTKDENRFKMLENSSGDFYGSTDSAVGKFLGYEKKARRYYEAKNEDDTLVRKEFENKLSELESKGKLDSRYEDSLALVDYIPYPDEEHIKEAKQRGEKRYEALKDSDIGRRLLEELETEADGGDPVKDGL